LWASVDQAVDEPGGAELTGRPSLLYVHSVSFLCGNWLVTFADLAVALVIRD
jgi:hypothetical protein